VTEKKFMREVKSFVRRAGRITPSQEKGLAESWPLYGLSIDDGLLDIKNMFKQQGEIVLEIGFGMGDSLVETAKAHPEKCYIGVDVHRAGVGALLAKMKKADVENIRIYCDDAIDVLEKCIADNSLDAVLIFFPDPWPKKKHHKRRLVQPEFLQLLSKKIKSKGILHLATDWGNYAEHMMEVLEASDDFENQQGKNKFAPRPEERFKTKFEKRGEKLGHDVWDLVFCKK